MSCLDENTVAAYLTGGLALPRVDEVDAHLEGCVACRELVGWAARAVQPAVDLAAAGETVVVPPGTPHLAWNPTHEVVRLRITMQPPLRWAHFVERLFAGADPADLLREFSREIRLA